MSKLQARNEIIIATNVSVIWSVITDINLFPRINTGVVKVTGRMDRQGEKRTCEIINKGKRGVITERLIELIPQSRTVWTIENDTMGMAKMVKDTRFVFELHKISEEKTRVVSDTYYVPANFIAGIMNRIMMRRMFKNVQASILNNMKSLIENR